MTECFGLDRSPTDEWRACVCSGYNVPRFNDVSLVTPKTRAVLADLKRPKQLCRERNNQTRKFSIVYPQSGLNVMDTRDTFRSEEDGYQSSLKRFPLYLGVTRDLNWKANSVFRLISSGLLIQRQFCSSKYLVHPGRFVALWGSRSNRFIVTKRSLSILHIWRKQRYFRR